ncbi:MAG: hypothetical protein M9962_10345 [Oligoflexia bacterium]|nr:hypothetical protein [Oligoflexia bacterium]
MRTPALVSILALFLNPSSLWAENIDACEPSIIPSTLDPQSRDSVEFLLEVPEALLSVTTQLDTLTPECANKIWSKSGIGTYQVILIDPLTKQPWLWRPKGFLGAKDQGGLEKLDPKELEKSPELLRSKYSFTNFRGKKTVGLLMGESGFRTFEQEKEVVKKMKEAGRIPNDFELTEELYVENKKNTVEKDFSTLVHEGFHAYGQGVHHENDGHNHRWAFVSKQDEDLANGIIHRYSDFPLEAGPRYYRRMQFETLYKALSAETEEEKQKFISQAAHWQDQYKSSSDEYIRTNGSDIGEGSANYFDFIAEIYSKHGCEMDDATLKELIRKGIDELVAQLDKQGGLPPMADVESYNIGLLASLLLDEENPVKNWKEKITNKLETPIEILVVGKSRIKGQENQKAKELISQAQKKSNNELAGLMKGLVSHAQDKEKWVRVQLPDSPGSLQHRGYFKTQGLNGAVIAASATKAFSKGAHSIQIENISLLSIQESGCPKASGTNSNYIFVPKSSLKTINGLTEFNFTDQETAFNDSMRPVTPKAQGSGNFEVLTDHKGSEWYCQK